MQLKNTFNYLGIFLFISGLLSLLPVGVALYYSEDPIPSLISSVLYCIFGFILFKKFSQRDLNFGDAMILAAISFLIVSLFGAIPFFMSSLSEGYPLEDKIINSYLESVSGFTTTGISIFPSEKYSPSAENYHSFVFRRTLSEWIGGLGVIILFLSLLAKGGHSTVYLYKLGRSEKITPSVERTARIIFRVYIFYTLIGAMLLWILNFDFFHSLTAIMSTLSTGGFIFLDQGFQEEISREGNSIILGILAISMLIGSIPFTLHYTLFGGNLRKFFNNLEIKAMLFLIIFFALVFFLLGFNEPIFTVISALTTTGHPMPFQDMSDLQKFLLVILVVVGAGAGSTAGGIKLIRLSVLSKAIFWLIRKISLPETAIFPLKVRGKVFEEKELREIALFFFIYIVLLTFSSSVLLFSGQKLSDSLLLSASVQGTSSLTPIEVRELGILPRILLIFQMIAGRLEIFPVLALIGYFLRGVKKEAKVVDEKVELERRLKILRKLGRL